MNKPHIYLASGWFNPEMKKQMDEVYVTLCILSKSKLINFFSPFYDGIVLKKGDLKLRKKMKEVWELDIAKVLVSDLIVACTQDHDVGTIFECGYASAKGIKILCYNSRPEFGLNLMLAQEASGFVKTQIDLKYAIENFVEIYYQSKHKTWVWNLWKGDPI